MLKATIRSAHVIRKSTQEALFAVSTAILPISLRSLRARNRSQICAGAFCFKETPT